MMPPKLLTGQEKRERAKTPFPSILRYGFFAEEFKWDKYQVDSLPEGYLTDLISRAGARSAVQEAVTARSKRRNRSRGVEVIGRSAAQIRADMGEAARDIPDEAFDRLAEDEESDEDDPYIFDDDLEDER